MKLKKWVPILLAMLLILTQAAGVSAEVTEDDTFTSFSEALAAGREIAYSAKVNWLSPNIVDEKINAALKAFFDALSVSGRMATSEEKTYSSFVMALDGNPVCNADTIAYPDGTVFLSSPVYGGTIAMNPEDMPQYFENLFAVMNEMPGMDPEMYQAIMQGYMAGVQSAAMAMSPEGGESGFPGKIMVGETEIDLAELMQSLPIEALDAAISGWAETALAVESIEGPMSSASGIECARADVYTIDKEELSSLLEALSTILSENDLPVELILALSGVTEEQLAEQGATVEDIAEQFKGLFSMLPFFAQTLPDGSNAALYDCYDEQDEKVLSFVRVTIPGGPQPVAQGEAVEIAQGEPIEVAQAEEEAAEEKPEEEGLTAEEAPEEEVMEEEAAEGDPEEEAAEGEPEEEVAEGEPEEAPAEDQLFVDIEWTPDFSFVYAFALNEGSGLEFYAVKAPEEVTEQDNAVVTDNLSQLNLTIIEDNAAVFQFGVDFYSMKAENGSTVSHEKGIVAGYYTEESSNAVEFSIQHHQTPKDGGLSVTGEVNCTLYVDGEVMPLCVIMYSAETKEPSGAPFDETAAGVVYPAKMAKEEFAGWFYNELTPSMTKTGLYIMSQLPNEFYALMVAPE